MRVRRREDTRQADILTGNLAYGDFPGMTKEDGGAEFVLTAAEPVDTGPKRLSAVDLVSFTSFRNRNKFEFSKTKVN